MDARALNDAVAIIQEVESERPSDLGQIGYAIGELDELLDVVSRYVRRLSSALGDLPGTTDDLEVADIDGTAAPEFVCNRAAIHLQAAATGIDQARTAVSMAHQLSGRLRSRGR